MKIDLTNKFIFWSIIALVVLSLTTINNYYFYDYMQVLSERNSKNLKQQLELVVKHCKIDNVSDQICEKHIIDATLDWSIKPIYNKSLQVKTLNGENNIITDGSKYYLANSFKYSSATGTSIIVDIKPLLANKNNWYKLESKFYQLMGTVYRSATLSLEDTYNSLNKNIKSNFNGKIISITKKHIFVQYNNQKIAKYRYYRHDELHIKDGDLIQKNQLLISGNIHSALSTFIHFIPRSRPFLGYLLIVFILLTIYKKREKAYKDKIIEIEKKSEDAQKKHDEETRAINDQAANKLSKTAKIEEEENRVCEGFIKFDGILNPPVDTIHIKELLDDNLIYAATAFRQVLEKIIFKIYDKKISNYNPKRTLASAIYELEQNNIIGKKLSQTLHAVRIYGNDFTHYSSKHSTKTEALVAAMNLLSIMEEMESIYLDTINNKDT